MKNLIFLLLSLFSITVFSQNITNTLGTSGVFTIKDGTTTFFSLTQSTGLLSLTKGLNLPITTSSTTGVLSMGGVRFMHCYDPAGGWQNLFLGYNSGNFTMSGSFLYARQNTGIGNGSLSNLTTGTDNTGVGYNSLLSNTTGFNNTAVGGFSLYTNTIGYQNTALGDQSLYYNTGYQNTAVGYQSLNSNTTGYFNTGLGSVSLHNNTTGYYNTALGSGSSYYNVDGFCNTSIGQNSLCFNTTGDYNTAVGFQAADLLLSGNNVTCIGFDSDPSSNSVSNEITLGNGSVSTLRCNTTTITALSDARDKRNIKDLNLGIDFLMKVKPRIYNWDKREWYENGISDGTKIQETSIAGFIAQELDEVQTTENAEWLNLVLKDNPEKLEATPGNLLPIVVKAIQDLKTENDGLKTENTELKERLSKLEQLQNLISLEIDKLKSKNSETKEVKLGGK